MEASIKSKNTNLILRAYISQSAQQGDALHCPGHCACLWCPSLAEDPGEGGSLAVISEGSDDY